MKLKFKRMHPKAQMPIRATEGACGWDLVAAGCHYDEAHFAWIYDSGIAVEIPTGYVGVVCARSSVFKTGCIPASSIGVIDNDYIGSIHFVFSGEENRKPYELGERFAQLLILPLPFVEMVEVEELTATKRGMGGFGSTGK